MKREELVYVIPTADAVEICGPDIICQSGGIDNMEIDEDAGNMFN